MTEPYTYTDPYGCRLRIAPSRGDKADVELACIDNADVDALATDLPTIVGKLYEAAGQPNPLADRLGQHVMQDIVDRRDLLIEPSIRAEGAVYFGQSSARGWHIRTEDLPELVGALYEAAGQQPPILLPRYEADATMTRGRKVRPMLIPSGEDMTIAEARDLASWYATAADLAEAEPDPQLITHLADVVTRAGVLGSAAETIARAVLAAGYAKAGES